MPRAGWSGTPWAQHLSTSIVRGNAANIRNQQTAKEANWGKITLDGQIGIAVEPAKESRTTYGPLLGDMMQTGL